MINTYNETSLHKELKENFATKYQGKTEIEVENFICDIVCQDKNSTIIEIQTANLSKLTSKIEKLTKNHKVNLVYPLAITTYIQRQNENGKILSKRKSPKKKNIYSIFGELFSLHQFLDNPNFSLTVLPIEQCVVKTVYPEPIQTPNKKRRFKRDWLITDKILLKHENEIIFNSKDDLKSLLPKEIPEIFSSKDLAKTEVKKEANKMIWVLKKAKIIEQCDKKGNLILYKKNLLN